MLPTLQIGPLALPTAELLLLIGFWIGLELTEKQAVRFGVEPGTVYNTVLVAIIAGLIGARLGYAARAPAAFLQSPLGLLALSPQMMDSTIGLLAAFLAGLIACWTRRLALWPMLDAVTTLLAVLAVTLGLSHFAAGSAFGAPANLPWSILLWGEQRHPAQVYETLAAMAVAAAVWPGSKIASLTQKRPGLRFWIFLGLSAAARLFLEAFRGDSTLLLGGLRQAQLIAWLLLALSLWQIGRRLNAAEQLVEQKTAP